MITNNREMIFCLQIYEIYCSSGNGVKMKINYDNGYYIGDVDYNEERHGYGKYCWNDGSYYEGEWYCGDMHGNGKRVYDDGSYYIGNFIHDERHGQGKYCWNDGTYYDGEWRDGSKFGHGKETYDDGSYYVGDFVNDKRHGQGKLVWGPNNYYEGEWYCGDMHGHGKRVYDDGSYYIGNFIHDERHGQGKFVWGPNNYYEGEFKNGDFNGRGIRYYTDGTYYDGEWRDDRKSGHGFMKYSDKTYDGYWESDDWKGNGKVIQNNGIEAEGVWNGSGNAKNVSFYMDGHIKKGIIIDGNFEEEISESIEYANKGSTAKIIPQNLIEELALKEVRDNPFTSDAKILHIVMGDPRWTADDGWVKVERIVNITHLEGGTYNIAIHYVGNIRTKEVDDFKIKYVKRTN